MKRNRFLLFFLIVLFIAFVPGMCFAQEQGQETGGELLQDTENLLERIQVGDIEAVQAALTTEAGSGLSQNSLQSMQEYFRGSIEDIGIENVALNTTNDLAKNTTYYERSGTIRVKTSEDKYYVFVQQVKEGDGEWLFRQFNIVNAAEYAAVTAVDTQKNASAQPIMIAVTIVFYAVIIWAIVACVKAKIKLKWLWIIVIVLVTVILTFSGTGGTVNLNLNIGIYIGTFSNAYFLMNGSYELRIVLPVGAIIFLALKRLLERKYVNKQKIDPDMPMNPAAGGQMPPTDGKDIGPNSLK